MSDVKAAIDELSSQIKNPVEKAAFLATIKEETGFKAKDENLNYSVDKLIQMRDLWVDTKNTNNKQGFSRLEGMSDEQIENMVAEGPEAIGNKIYGGRLGNASNEGYKYRGRGLFQITGKHNYKKISKELFPEDPDKLVDNPDLINEPEIIKRAAEAYWTKIKNKVDFENTPQEEVMDKVTNIINPGTETRDRRKKYFGEFYQQEYNAEADQVTAEDEDKQLQKQYEWNKPAVETKASGNSLLDNMRQRMSTQPEPTPQQKMSKAVKEPNQLNDANSILGAVRGSVQPQVTQNKTMEIPKAQSEQASKPSLEGNSIAQNFQDVYKKTLQDHVKRVSLWQMKLGEGKIV